MLSFPVRFLLSAALTAVAAGCGAAQHLSIPQRHEAEQEPCEPTPPAHVRVLYIVDVSGSMTFVDPDNTRTAAIEEHLQHQTGADVQVGFVTFGSSVATTPFAPLESVDLAAAGLQNNENQVNTDLEGALLAARALIAQDVAQAPPQTRYRVVLITDGADGPRCCAVNEEQTSILTGYPTGCPVPEWVVNDDFGADARYCEGMPEQAICNVEDNLDHYRGFIASSGLPGEALLGFVAGADRNRSCRNVALVQEIDGLVQDAEGSLRFDAVQLVNPTLPAEIQRIYRIDSCALEVRLAAMTDAATEGQTLRSPPEGALQLPLDVVQCPDTAAAP